MIRCEMFLFYHFNDSVFNSNAHKLKIEVNALKIKIGPYGILREDYSGLFG